MSEPLNMAMNQADDGRDASPPAKKPAPTKGSLLFDLTTYGGITWILNEVISAKAGDAIDKPEGFFGKPFKQAVDWAEKHMNPAKWSRFWIDRPIRILVLCIGGTAVLPLVKWLEDHKRDLVHHADSVFEGDKVNTDPKIREAHAAIDAAPKQTWISLIQSRGLVMGLAITIDYLMGHEKSPTTKLLEHTPLKNYSNMERMGTTATRDVLARFHSDPARKAAIKEARDASKAIGGFKPINEKLEGPIAKAMGGNFGFVLILSAVLSGIFYVSSKIFANIHEKVVTHRHARRAQGSISPDAAMEPETGTDQNVTMTAELEKAEAADKPTTKIRDIEHERSAPAQQTVSAL